MKDKLQKRYERKFESGDRQDRSIKFELYHKQRVRTKVELLEVIRIKDHRLQLITRNSCKMFINQEGFKLPIEPEGKMSIRRTNTPIGAEYDISFAGSEEWDYIKAVFQTFAFMASR